MCADRTSGTSASLSPTSTCPRASTSDSARRLVCIYVVVGLRISFNVCLGLYVLPSNMCVCFCVDSASSNTSCLQDTWPTTMTFSPLLSPKVFRCRHPSAFSTTRCAHARSARASFSLLSHCRQEFTGQADKVHADLSGQPTGSVVRPLGCV
jgi:hypothetical protein